MFRLKMLTMKTCFWYFKIKISIIGYYRFAQEGNPEQLKVSWNTYFIILLLAKDKLYITKF